MLKKIKTKADKEKKQKRNNIILGIILVSLMLFSTMGYAFFSGGNNTSKKEYNGFDFIETNGFWATEIEGQVFYFTYLPSEIENVPIQGVYNLQDYSEKPLYFVNTDEAIGEILRTLGKYILRYQEACINDCNNTELPKKTCTENIIIFQKSEDLESSSEEIKTEVYKQDNCVYIIGDFIKASDAFLYRLLGVI